MTTTKKIVENREEPWAVQTEVAQTAVNCLIKTHLPEQAWTAN